MKNSRTKKNENISEDLKNKFESQWEAVQEGGSTKYPKVNKVLKEASKKYKDENELPESALKKVHKALQKEVFGKVLPSKDFCWAE